MNQIYNETAYPTQQDAIRRWKGRQFEANPGKVCFSSMDFPSTPAGAVARWRGGAVERWSGGAVERWSGGAVPSGLSL